MKYIGTVLSVTNIQKARQFYEDIFGLELDHDYGINISFTCGLSLQQNFGWLVNIPQSQIIDQPNNIELCFEEEHFDAFLERLQNYPEIQFLGPVIEHNWGQRVIRFYDLDGHLIEVGENMKKVVQRFLYIGMSMQDISIKMDVCMEDLQTLLKSE